MSITALSLDNGTFSIKNKQYFIDLSWLEGYWELMRDGVQVDTGELPELNIDVDKSTEVIVPVNKELMSVPAEYHINFHFITKTATAWCRKGHEVGWEQFLLSAPNKQAVVEHDYSPAVASKVIYEKDKKNIIISSGKLQLIVTGDSAETKLKYDGTEIIHKGPELQLWRAGTDNDGIRSWTGQEGKPLWQWLNAGLDQLQVISSTASVIENIDSVTVEIEKVSVGADPSLKISHLQKMTVTSAATIEVENKVVTPDGLPSLPRVGVVMTTAEGFNNLEWFGRGPHENHIDRNAGAPVGRYSGTVAGQYVPYILPQEHGNKSDVRWVELKNSEVALKFIADSQFEFSARHFSSADLFAVNHTCDLVPAKETVLSLDCIQRGVGTGSCGPQTMEKYCIVPGEHNFKYTIALSIMI